MAFEKIFDLFRKKTKLEKNPHDAVPPETKHVVISDREPPFAEGASGQISNVRVRLAYESHKQSHVLIVKEYKKLGRRLPQQNFSDRIGGLMPSASAGRGIMKARYN